jgi:hypothetical protein
MSRDIFISRYLPWIIVSWIFVMLLSLQCGWLDRFFWAAQHAHVQGIDYFALPKSFLNLLEHRSPYDSWQGVPFGPYATWYLAHPIFSVLVMPFFAFFPPWLSYIVFVFFSLSLMVYCGALYAKDALPEEKNMYYAFFLLGFPVYWMFYVGNMHAPLVLSLALILLSLYEMAFMPNQTLRANKKLLLGLLISFFTKPVVILLLPALFLVKETRKTTTLAFMIYALVSLVTLSVPFINPESVGWSKRFALMFDFETIKETMNIYKNQFHLNEYMKDNTIHWFNLIAQSGYRFNHIENFSFPVFLDTLFNRELPGLIYSLSIMFCLLCAIFLPFIVEKVLRLRLLLLVVMLTSVSYFLSYNTIWEYQYTSMLPVIAMLYRIKNSGCVTKKHMVIMLTAGAFYYLPSFYCLLDQSNMDLSFISMVRLSRSLATLTIFSLLGYQIVRLMYAAMVQQKSTFHVAQGVTS